MYRLMLESLLGLKREGNSLTLTPCLPEHWTSASIDYRIQDTLYKIVIVQSDELDQPLTLDGREQPDHKISLVNDGLTHYATLAVRRSAARSEMSPLCA
jgi:cellobiose phosphorylase